MNGLPQPRYMPCDECGASVSHAERVDHVCEPDRLGAFRLFQVRDEVAAFDGELAAYLDSPQGRFAAWCAERERAG